MPLDFRYHLASLAAVFSALIIGVLLGVAMKEGPVLSNQVQELRKEFHRFDTLRNLEEQTDQFNIATGKPLLRNRLYGRNVALVSNPISGSTAIFEPVRRTFEAAGATVTTEITLRPLLHELQTEQIGIIYQKLGVSPPSEHDAAADLMQRLALTIGSGSTTVTSVLQNYKLIRVKGDPEKPVSIIVFIGGASADDDYLDDADMPFLRGCLDRRLMVAAAEQMGAPRSVVDKYQKVAPYTVDNIDREAGRIALVLALSSDKPGHFGFKSSADDVTPELE